MARICQICKRKTLFGNKISHSNKKTSRKFLINLQKTRIIINNTKKTIKLCTSCQNLLKKGLINL